MEVHLLAKKKIVFNLSTFYKRNLDIESTILCEYVRVSRLRYRKITSLVYVEFSLSMNENEGKKGVNRRRRFSHCYIYVFELNSVGTYLVLFLRKIYLFEI